LIMAGGAAGAAAGTGAIAGKAGGLTSLSGGAGGQAAGTSAAGTGGAASLVGGAGGVKVGTTGAEGGPGGAANVTGGVGGTTATAGAQAAGAGGGVVITGAIGGQAMAGSGDGGAGGSITLTPGAGGATTGGEIGAPGNVTVSTGVLKMSRQTISVGNVDITMTLVPGTPSGTLMTGNVLRVTTTTGAHFLKLPPEADCDGMFVIINNVGGQTVNVQDDGGGAVDSLATTEFGFFFCDGTEWEGMNEA
ncbi:hypothetical protein LCGC14_3093380, partial [marine sediment metagenome]